MIVLRQLPFNHKRMFQALIVQRVCLTRLNMNRTHDFPSATGFLHILIYLWFDYVMIVTVRSN